MFSAAFKNRFLLFVRKSTTALIILLLTFSPVQEWVYNLAKIQFSFLPHVKELFADAGDFSIWREKIGGDVVASTTVPLSVTWDTVVSANSNISLQTGSSTIDLAEGGKYLVAYNVWTDEGTGGNERRSFETYLTVNGSKIPYGRGSGYLRDSGGDINAYAAGVGIINASAGDDLEVVINRDDTNAETAGIRANKNGVSVVKLRDDLEYIRLKKTSNTVGIESNTSFTNVVWDTSDEVDSGAYGFSDGNSQVTLKGDSGSHFIVSVGVGIEKTANSANRQNYEIRLYIDGNEITGTRVTTYPRGNPNTDGIYHGTLVYTGIIQKTSSSDQDLTIAVRRESQSSASTEIDATETSLAMVALPDYAHFVSLTSTSSDQSLTAAESTLNWNEQIEVDSGAFSHSTTSNNSRINFDMTGDYLFFSSAYTSRTSGTARNAPVIEWRLDGGAVEPYGGHGSFNRGDQASADAFTSGSAGAILLSGVSDTQYLEVTQKDEASGSPNAVFPAGRIGVQGVELSLISRTNVVVSSMGTQAANVVSPSIDKELGGTFVIKENDIARNITSITLSESGTINGATGLENIEMYFDLDTTFPYDCASESFSGVGSENQYGVTDSNGFSGPNGISSFSESVAISPTQTFCGYVVYDVTNAANDGETIDIGIGTPSNDVVVTGGGSVGPSVTQSPAGTTIVQNTELTQIHYNWREDNGSETTATSVEGSEDTPAGGFQAGTPRRLRIAVSTEGSAASPDVQYRLQYGEKVGTCSAVSSWTDVAEAGGAWDTFNSPNVSNKGNTTDIAEANGGVTNEEVSFYGANAQINGGDKSVSIALASDEFVELEYTVVPTDTAVEGTTYCFRVADEVLTATHGFRIPLTIQAAQVASTLTDFPVYVDLSTLGSHFFSNVRSDGGDIRVTTNDGETELSREIVSINTGGETGEMHFLAPTISSSANTTFYIYYGATDELEYQPDSTYGSESVWSQNYEVVYHFEENPGGTAPQYIDSTGNSVGTAINMESGDQVNGLVGKAASVDGVNEHIETNYSGSVLNSTWSIFLNANGTQGACDGTIFSRGTNISGLNYGGCQASNELGYHWNDDANSWGFGGGPIFPTNEWALAAMVVNSSQATFYSVTSSGLTSGVNTITHTTSVIDNLDFGWDSFGDTRSFSGTMDEARLLSVERTGDWLSAEYTNFASATSFYSVGTYETMSGAPEPIIYNVYPEASITADVIVSSLGSQVSSLNQGSTQQYVGGSFVIKREGTNRTLTDITFTETGSINATELENPRLYYDLATDCSAQSYSGAESSFFGSAFTGANGSTTFSSLGITLNTSQVFCGYVIFDVATGATNGETINIGISNPSNDVVVTTSSVGPSTNISPDGSTTVAGPVLTQTHYHWRNDNGDEGDTGATSATGGVEDTPLLDVGRDITLRLRTQVSNEGTVGSQATSYRLEYGTKISSCSNIGTWTQVGAGVAFATSTSTFISDGNTTDIDDTGRGAMTEENITFVGTGALRESSSESGLITLSSTEYTELEFSIAATDLSGYETDYCFRVTDGGTPLLAYNQYPELTTREKQDFFVQRGSVDISGTGQVFVAGTDYVAPAATSSAFVRITSSQITGAGNIIGGGTQAPREVTAYISDQSDITSSFTISRPPGALRSTHVDWEIVEYIGLEGADNEMKVRDVGSITYGASALSATGTTLANVEDDSDIVVYITGQESSDIQSGNFLGNQSTALWNASSSTPVFKRGTNTGGANRVSYAVVEYSGLNWKVQRVEHNYSSSVVTETESITAVTSVNSSFIHAQKRVGDIADNGLNDYGHQVWLSGIGQVSFFLGDVQVGNPAEHYSVAWVIENTQTGDGALTVHRVSGSVDGSEAVEPRYTSVGIGGVLNNLSNASLFITNDSTGDGSAFPRAMLGATATSTTQFELFESDAGQVQSYRVAVVEWPVAQLAFVQNYYRFYVDNDNITPTDPWPAGMIDLGENTSVTTTDEPLGESERIRIRMTLSVNNALWPELTKSFKLQYGRRDTTCSAVSAWNDVGAAGSGVFWRGYNATPNDGTVIDPGSLLISVSNIGGTYEEENNSAANPVTADIGDNVEFDWIIEHNGAVQRSDYCFRMVESDGSVLSAYNNYPTVRTTGYTPVMNDWRWYDDENNETPTTPLAATNTAPVDISNQEVIKLRVVATEVESASGQNVKFGLQYSQYSDFSDGGISLVSSSTCSSTSTWCYADGAGIDNAVITTNVLSSADSCVAGVGDGCGTHNETYDALSTLTHPALSSKEFEFTIRQANARVSGVYYFRLVDISTDDPLGAVSSYPSLVTEGSQLSFSVSGLSAGTVSEGVTADVSSTPSGVAFGTLPIDTEYEALYRLSINTNATQGYQMLMYAAQPMENTYGEQIPGVTGSNESPSGWSIGCQSTATGCFGYHVGDDILANGSTRFAADDSYAALSSTPQEVMYSSVPANESSDIVYKIQVSELQPAGDYEAEIVYLAIPVF